MPRCYPTERCPRCSPEGSGTAVRGRRAASGGADFVASASGRRKKIGGAALSLTPDGLAENGLSERDSPRPRSGAASVWAGVVWRGWFTPFMGGGAGGGGACPAPSGESLRGAACPPLISKDERSIRSPSLILNIATLGKRRKTRRLAPPGPGLSAQNGMSSSRSRWPAPFSLCCARLRKSTVSAMISLP